MPCLCLHSHFSFLLSSQKKKNAMEPLIVLREFASSGRLAQVSLSQDARTVKFGDQFEFAADAPTRWRAKGAAAAVGPSATSTMPLGALAFFATSATFFDKAPWGDYLKNARAAGLATVPVVDRKVKRREKREERRRRRRERKKRKRGNRRRSQPPPLSKKKHRYKKQPLTNFLLGEYDGADHLMAASEAAAAAVVPAEAGRKRKLEEEAGATGVAAAAATAAAAADKPGGPGRAASPSSPLDPLAVTRSLELSLRDRNSQMLSGSSSKGAAVGGGGFSFASVLEQADKAAAAEKAARARGSAGGGGSSVPVAPSSARRGGAPSTSSTLGPIAALPSRRFERDRAPGAGAGGGAAGAGAGAAAAAAAAGAQVEGLAEFGELGIQLYGGAEARAAKAAEAEAAAAAAAEARQRAMAASASASASASAAAKSKRPLPGAPSSRAPANAAVKDAGVSGGLPIIVVPAAATARLNMLNAPAFFANGTFEHPDALRAAGAKKSSSATVVREVAREGAEGGASSSQPGSSAAAAAGGGAGAAAAAAAAGAAGAAAAANGGDRYFITDRTDGFRSLDWSRVVAVVVSGAAWQFKGWPFKGLKEGHTVDLFSKVAGVFVGYGDEEPPPTVKTWNVTRHGLHREARHRDRSVASAVWRAIDAMGASRRARALG